MPTRFARAFYPHLLVYLLYLLVALVITYPLVTVLGTRFAGHPFGDSYELARHIWWMKDALQTGQPVFWQPLLAYPAGLDGSLLWSYPLQSFPAWLFAFAMPLPAAFNVSILLRLALDGWAAFYLARYLTGQSASALLAGLAFMAYPTFQGHLAAGHTGLLALWAFPLYVYALFSLRETGRRKWIAAGALLFVVGTWGGTQLLVFTLLPATALFALALILRRAWRMVGKVVLTALLGGLLALVFALPLLISTFDSPPQPETGVVDYSADLLAVIAPSPYHPLLKNDLSARVLGVDPFEGAAYAGVIPALLALVAVWKQPASRWWLALALVVWVFSLGPLLKGFDTPVIFQVDGYDSYLTLPWAAFYDLPLVNITRTPGRFNFALALAVAMLAGYGAAWLLRGRLGKRRAALVFMAAALILFEYQFWWAAPANGVPLPGLPTVPGVVPEGIARLAQRGDIRAVFDIPWEHPLVGKEGLWLQTGHRLPLVAGHMTRETPVDPAKLALLQETLDPALLNAAGADILILHKRWDDPAGETEAWLRAQLGAPVYEDDDYAVFDAPRSNAAPEFVALPAPDGELTDQSEVYLYAPAPGSFAFAARLERDADERAVALWLDGVRLQSWTVSGALDIAVSVAVGSAGYHTLALALEPPCPEHHAPALECRAVQLRGVTLSAFEAG